MLPEDKQKILHRRHVIIAIATIIIITFLGLWEIVFWFAVGLFMLWLVMWFIGWATGADLYNSHPNQPSDEEKTMWDIFTAHEMTDRNNHDDTNDHN